MHAHATDGPPLQMFACPNPECDLFNQFGAGNLSVVERTGKKKHICRLYCNHCGCRFSERRGSLMEYTKLPQQAVARVFKCLVHGCSVEATADICEVDPRTVQRMVERGGPRAEEFHRQQLEQLSRPPEVVEMDELHTRVHGGRPCKKGEDQRTGGLGYVARRVWTGFTRRWIRSRDS